MARNDIREVSRARICWDLINSMKYILGFSFLFFSVDLEAIEGF